MHKTIKQLLVGIDKCVQLMRNSKYGMEVCTINDFGLTCIYPDLFEDGLTVWTVAVTTGIIVLCDSAAFSTKHTVKAAASGMTVHNRLCCMLLFPGQMMVIATFVIL